VQFVFVMLNKDVEPFYHRIYTSPFEA